MQQGNIVLHYWKGEKSEKYNEKMPHVLLLSRHWKTRRGNFNKVDVDTMHVFSYNTDMEVEEKLSFTYCLYSIFPQCCKILHRF